MAFVQLLLVPPLLSATLLGSFLKCLVPSKFPDQLSKPSSCEHYSLSSFRHIRIYPQYGVTLLSDRREERRPDLSVEAAIALQSLQCPFVVEAASDGSFHCLETIGKCDVIGNMAPAEFHPLTYTLLGILAATVVFWKARGKPGNLSPPPTSADGLDEFNIYSEDEISEL